KEILRHLDEELRIGEIPDYPGAHNGLQMEGAKRVSRVAAAVDASLPVVRRAAEAGADLLVVHHGMFWNGVKPVTGPTYAKFRTALDAGLAIYSVHIPLDVHPVLGNNARLVAALELDDPGPFLEWKGIQLGMCGRFEGSLDELVDRAGKVLGERPHVCPAGPEAAGMVGVITGGAGGEVEAVAASGVDTFLTGEGPHWSFPAAEELGLNVLYGGHYATETFGVRAVGAHLSETFGVEWDFLDHPTGL
ncbi:MAG: Nif3-like dinuclear metal center hexameric protein, partial [Akkermansiaceae bacterium]|nr:Nif3-like dinuclear metal center hexameric protein [Akkermansiaceae bacterium]